MSKKQIAVLFGGCSPEHEISIMTALQSMRAIDSCRYDVIPVYLSLNGRWYTGDPLFERSFFTNTPHNYSKLSEVTIVPDRNRRGLSCLPSLQMIPIDCCFLAFHGKFGEDGCVQGLLELADIPYTGCDVFSSALSMNKFHCKRIAESFGANVLPSMTISIQEARTDFQGVLHRILEKFSLPIFIKPNHLGSSIGITTVNSVEDIRSGLARVFAYDSVALIEPYIEEMVEINVAVLDGKPPLTSLIEVPFTDGEALSYEDKYVRGCNKTSGGSFQGMAGLTRAIDPIDIEELLKGNVKATALEIFQGIGCSGLSRLDFMYATKIDVLYFNEINPIPGSFAYYLWDKMESPILYTELIDRLINRAFEKKNLQLSLKGEFGFNAIL